MLSTTPQANSPIQVGVLSNGQVVQLKAGSLSTSTLPVVSTLLATSNKSVGSNVGGVVNTVANSTGSVPVLGGTLKGALVTAGNAIGGTSNPGGATLTQTLTNLTGSAGTILDTATGTLPTGSTGTLPIGTLPTGTGNPLAPVTSAVSTITGALSGAAGGSSPLAPVTTTVSTVTGTLSGATGGSTSPLAPVTGALSTVTGAL
ncbi:hypothetical protein FE249_17240 [Acidiphilium multivorum]|uniref:hypothetical protein n=1 Tax=Acidiphilium multivorum TaxID=62140 RepID=UPI001F4C02E8|nr:hypothetical protein [Acidiphilium multivorum]UNC15842.1 hypothetical protein FE249_17240 [Acidiphilium multivorum]